MKRAWFYTAAHSTGSSLDLVRIMAALILIIHPVHAWMHPGDLSDLGHFLTASGFPFGVALAFAVTLLQFVCSLALLLRRFVVQACIGQIVVLLMAFFSCMLPGGVPLACPMEITGLAPSLVFC